MVPAFIYAFVDNGTEFGWDRELRRVNILDFQTLVCILWSGCTG